MMIKMIKHDIDIGLPNGVLFVDRDSIMVIHQCLKTVTRYRYKANGEREYSSEHQVDVEYNEIVLKNGYAYQVFNELNSIYEMVNAK